MQYEKYELKIQKIENFFKLIFRHMGKIITVASVIAVAITSLLVAKGTVTSEMEEEQMTVVYGERFRYEAKAFWSDVEYEYCAAGTEAWSKDLPLVPGEYHVRAVAKATIGKRYGSVEDFTVVPKPIEVSIASAGVIYGSEPVVSSDGLVYADHIAGASFTYNEDRSHAEITSVQICDENGTDITSRYEIQTVGRDIYTAPRPLNIEIPSVEKIYDGTPLASDQYAITDGTLAAGDSMEVLFSVAQTDVGKVQNLAEYKMTNADGEDVTQHYKLVQDVGYLTVLKREVSIKTEDLSVTYDDTVHGAPTYSVTGELALAEGHTLSASDWATITEAGTKQNRFSQYRLLDAEGKDVTANYTLSCEWGMLTVHKRAVCFQTPNAEQVYNGQALSRPVCETVGNVALVEGHTYGISKYATLINAGNILNELDVEILNADGKNVTNNYEIDGEWGTLTVHKRTIVLTTGTGSQVYNGQALSTSGSAYDRSALLDGHNITLTDKTLTDVGECENIPDVVITDANGENVADNYDFVSESNFGTLTVTKKSITIVSQKLGDENGHLTYDGTEHNINSGLTDVTSSLCYDAEKGIEHSFEITHRPSLKDVARDEDGNVVSIENKLTFYIKDENGVDVTDNYDFDVNAIEWQKITVDPLAITVESKKLGDAYGHWIYDGTDHSYESDLEATLCDGHAFEITYRTPLKNVAKDEGGNVTSIENKLKFEIQDENGKDVTANYVFDEIEWQDVTIDPLRITIKTQDLTEEYTGKEWTQKKWVILSGALADGQTLSTDNITGKQTNVTTDENGVDNTYEASEMYIFYVDENGEKVDATENYDITASCGKLKIAKKAITVMPVWKGEDTYKFTYDGTDHSRESDLEAALCEGHAFEITKYTTLQNVARENDLVTSIKNTLTFYIKDENGQDVTANYDFDESTIAWHNITILPREITFQTSDAEKTYDGKALEDKEWKDEILVAGHTRSLPEITGTQTDATDENGVENTYKTTDDTKIFDANGQDVTANYDITLTCGKLIVHKREIAIETVKIGDANGHFTYDGKEHQGESGLKVTSGSLCDGHSIDITHRPSLKNVARVGDEVVSIRNELTFRIVDRENNDVTANYQFDNVEWQDVTIDPRAVTVTTASARRVYDATPLTADGWHPENLVAGHTLSFPEITGTQTNATDEIGVDNTYDTLGEQKILDATGQDVTANYAITVKCGKLVVDRRALVVRSNGYEGVYDGINHADKTLTDASVGENTGLCGGAVFAPIASVEILNVFRGNSGEPDWFANQVEYDILLGGVSVKDNYACEELWALVIVREREITVQTASAEKVYDGYALTKHEWVILAGTLVPGQTLSTANITGTRTNVVLAPGESADNTYRQPMYIFYIDEHGAEVDVTANYRIMASCGTLTVTKRNITIESLPIGNFTYDGYEHNGQSGLRLIDGSLCDGHDWNITYRPSLKNVARDANGNVIPILNKLAFYIQDENGNDVSDNYAYDEEAIAWEEITISRRNITIESLPIGNFTYDGYEHNGQSGLRLINGSLCDAHDWNITYRPSLKKVATDGEGNVIPILNKLAFYIQDENGYDVSDNYAYDEEAIAWEEITISRRNITIESLPIGNFTYDGYEHNGQSGLRLINGSLCDAHDWNITYRPSLKKVARDANGNVIPILNKLEFHIQDEEGNDASDNYAYDEESIAWEEITISPIRIVVGSEDQSYVYDSEAHEDTTLVLYDNTALAVPDFFANVNALKSFVNVSDSGTNEISFAIRQGSEDMWDSYTVETRWGTITIRARTITVRTGSETWVYDGLSHANDTLTVISGRLASNAHNLVPKGQVPTITEVGSLENVFEATVDGTEEGNYNILYEYGMLTIKAQPIEIKIHLYPTTVEYNGREQAPYIDTFQFVNETELGVDLTIHRIHVGQTKVGKLTSADINAAGSAFDFRVLLNGEDVTEHYCIVVVSANGDANASYDVLTVEKRKIEITSGSWTQADDGKELTYRFAHISKGSLGRGDALVKMNTAGEYAFVTGSQLGKGESVNGIDLSLLEIKNASGVDVTDQYEITVVTGRLHLT